jgi:hypothetical protein
MINPLSMGFLPFPCTAPVKLQKHLNVSIGLSLESM